MQRQLTCLLYGEGRNEKEFLNSIIKLNNFKYHTKGWFFMSDNASGGDAKTILDKCSKIIIGKEYDLVICFVDTDILKKDSGRKFEEEKKKLEHNYENIKIFWQEENLEDEKRRIIGDTKSGKWKITKLSKENPKLFINSSYYKRILEIVKLKEKKIQK